MRQLKSHQHRGKWAAKRSTPNERMFRLLKDGEKRDRVEVEYHQQWATFFKAVRLGYITDQGQYTESGRAFIRSHDQSETK